MSDWPLLTSHANPVWAVGVLLESFATFAGCAGKQMLRYAATSHNNSFYLVGTVLVGIIDPIFDLSAYTLAAQSIIAPYARLASRSRVPDHSLTASLHPACCVSRHLIPTLR